MTPREGVGDSPRGWPARIRRSERMGRDVQDEDHDVFRSGISGVPKGGPEVPGGSLRIGKEALREGVGDSPRS
eukprot:7542803-Heterocapsa_arctica.AAC.1